MTTSVWYSIIKKKCFYLSISKCLYLLVFLSLALISRNATAISELQLPVLGDASAGIISPSQERELGQRWQRMFRSQVPTSTDPFIQLYIESLVKRLSTYSDIEDKRIDVLVVEDASLNAFAVPGGVMGVNTGLFNYAQTHEQFASVIAHELAHLSQRHFARRLGEQRDNSIPNMAALLASILIAVTAGGDAGVAAIAVTQAAMVDQQLRFSRQMEQEADRVGMTTMVRADYDPYAMPDMFEQMLHASRFQRRPPEFLLTHPLTSSRVSDSKQRAQQYPRRPTKENLEYQLLKTRAELMHESNTQATATRFANALEGYSGNTLPNRYGLALAQLKQNRPKEAKQTTQALLSVQPDNVYFISLMAEIEAEMGEFNQAIERLNEPLKTYTDHHALNIKLAEILMKAGQYTQCETLLNVHSKRRPKDDYIWYLLAETHGLAGNILQVHTARTEYFILNGLYDKAENQIRNGLALAKKGDRDFSKLEQRLRDVRKMRRETL